MSAYFAAPQAISGVLSVLLEVPIEHAADEAALLETLALANWSVPDW